jgi:hypothetical protein
VVGARPGGVRGPRLQCAHKPTSDSSNLKCERRLGLSHAMAAWKRVRFQVWQVSNDHKRRSRELGRNAVAATQAGSLSQTGVTRCDFRQRSYTGEQGNKGWGKKRGYRCSEGAGTPRTERRSRRRLQCSESFGRQSASECHRGPVMTKAGSELLGGEGGRGDGTGKRSRNNKKKGRGG